MNYIDAHLAGELESAQEFCTMVDDLEGTIRNIAAMNVVNEAM